MAVEQFKTECAKDCLKLDKSCIFFLLWISVDNYRVVGITHYGLYGPIA